RPARAGWSRARPARGSHPRESGTGRARSAEGSSLHLVSQSLEYRSARGRTGVEAGREPSMVEQPAGRVVLYEERDRIAIVTLNRPEKLNTLNEAVMGLRTPQLLGTFFDGVTRHTEEALRWREQIGERGFRET